MTDLECADTVNAIAWRLSRTDEGITPAELEALKRAAQVLDNLVPDRT